MIRTVGRASSVATSALAAAALCSWATGFSFFVALLIEAPAVAAGVVALHCGLVLKTSTPPSSSSPIG